VPTFDLIKVGADMRDGRPDPLTKALTCTSLLGQNVCYLVKDKPSFLAVTVHPNLYSRL